MKAPSKTIKYPIILNVITIGLSSFLRTHFSINENNGLIISLIAKTSGEK